MTRRLSPRTVRRGLVGLLVAVLLVGVSVWVVRAEAQRTTDLATRAALSASSTRAGSYPADATSKDGGKAHQGWRSGDETTGAWLELAWSRPIDMRRIVVRRNPLSDPGALAGFLTFSDGSQVEVTLSLTSTETVLEFTRRRADRVRFTVTKVGSGTRFVTVQQIRVDDDQHADGVLSDSSPDGDVAPAAVLTTSGPHAVSEPGALVDRDPRTGGAGGVGSFPDPRGAWVQLSWARPREITTIALAGAPAAALVESATVTFSDGSQLALGAVLADSTRPTVVSFMPRVATSVRVTLDELSGSGAGALSEIMVLQRGAPARTVTGGTVASAPLDSLDCNRPVDRPTDKIGLVVLCPTTGAEVGGQVTLRVAVGPSYSTVSATAWPADITVAPSTTVQAKPGPGGAAQLVLDVSAVPPGPFTVQLQAGSSTAPPATALFQLDRQGSPPTADVASSHGADGRSLVFAEEFDRPISVSRTGEGADYTGSKPVYNGAQDFGDAVFADPDAGFGTLSVQDDRYLKISVKPLPAGFRDPQGWGRTHLGGILASARPGGSGFSAQYGYFEARILAPAAPGTWPAFWMLPAPNLVKTQPTEAEVDAVELYGHDPKYSCQSTHEHVGRGEGVARCAPRFDTQRAAMAWHTYGVSVGPAVITFYIDGAPVATAPQVSGGDVPLYFLLDLSLGGGWPISMAGVQNRAELYVDYVRVYE